MPGDCVSQTDGVRRAICASGSKYWLPIGQVPLRSLKSMGLEPGVWDRARAPKGGPGQDGYRAQEFATFCRIETVVRVAAGASPRG